MASGQKVPDVRAWPTRAAGWSEGCGRSSAHLSQPVVRLGVGDDGLNGYDGLVDPGLQLAQLLDVQQPQDLSRFVQSGVCGWKKKV